MAEPVIVRMDVTAPTSSTLMGRREELIADSLRHSGIPAQASKSGISVTEGELDVYEEDGLRVFQWTPPDAIKVPIPEGDNNPEVQELKKPKKRS